MQSGRQKFSIEGCVGKGGYGEVYRATMTSAGGLQKRVAIKTLLSDVAPGSDAVRRLRDEARLLAALNHRNILTVFDLLVLNGRIALLMEYIEGEDLSTLAHATPPMNPRAVVQSIGEVANALDAAYNAPVGANGAPLRLVHRDIKPSNIRIDPQGAVKLLDFGIARAPDAEREAKTGTGLVVGTVGYLSPERFDDLELDTRSDVYALGCVLYEMLVGEQLFLNVPKRKLFGLMIDPERHDAFLVERMARLPRDTHPQLRALLDATLAYEGDDRLNAAELEHRCEDLAPTLGGRSLRQWCRQHPWRDVVMQPGDWDGLVLSSGELIDSAAIDQWQTGVGIQPPTKPTLVPETMDFDLDPPSPPLASAPPSGSTGSLPTRKRRSRVPLMVGGAAVTLVLVGGAALAVGLGALAFSRGGSPNTDVVISAVAQVDPQEPASKDPTASEPALAANEPADEPGRAIEPEQPVAQGAIAAADTPAANDATPSAQAQPSNQAGPDAFAYGFAPAVGDIDVPLPTQAAARNEALPPSLDPAVTSSVSKRTKALAGYRTDRSKMDAIMIVLKTDPDASVRKAAWMALWYRYRRGVGDPAQAESHVVWVARHERSLESRREAVEVLCRHAATVQSLERVLAVKHPAVRGHLVAECGTWIKHNPSLVPELRAAYQRALEIEDVPKIRQRLQAALRGM